MKKDNEVIVELNKTYENKNGNKVKIIRKTNSKDFKNFKYNSKFINKNFYPFMGDDGNFYSINGLGLRRLQNLLKEIPSESIRENKDMGNKETTSKIKLEVGKWYMTKDKRTIVKIVSKAEDPSLYYSYAGGDNYYSEDGHACSTPNGMYKYPDDLFMEMEVKGSEVGPHIPGTKEEEQHNFMIVYSGGIMYGCDYEEIKKAAIAKAIELNDKVDIIEVKHRSVVSFDFKKII